MSIIMSDISSTVVLSKRCSYPFPSSKGICFVGIGSPHILFTLHVDIRCDNWCKIALDTPFMFCFPRLCIGRAMNSYLIRHINLCIRFRLVRYYCLGAV